MLHTVAETVVLVVEDTVPAITSEEKLNVEKDWEG